MADPFIMNHQYNFIKKQADIVQNAFKTVNDPKVLEAVRYSAQCKVLDMFVDRTDEQKQLAEQMYSCKTTEEFQQYLHSLVPYIIDFPQVSQKQISKLFPKNKKLKLPDLSTIDYHALSYLGWLDISTNKLFMVYPLNGKVIGVEGRYTPANRKGICFLCNGYGEVALFSAISKTRVSHLPDYYKAVGNYICMDSHGCNKNITDVTSLERFVQEVVG
ncbi:FusB/FusC family EF-G-binding protein [Brevibacillus ginsengisoli]|uniref:FusB/FusC family EF-G-binding protein n=1 Tax=Brevibacillus ginsengisoli TaxID=363854 RepID=UPI003CF7385B